jgi:hypothetical protein
MSRAAAREKAIFDLIVRRAKFCLFAGVYVAQEFALGMPRYKVRPTPPAEKPKIDQLRSYSIPGTR